MVTTLLVTIWYDGASEYVAPTVDSYDSAAPPIGAFAFFNTYDESGFVPPEPEPTPTPETTPGGVGGKRRVFRMADMRSREELENFLKSHVRTMPETDFEKPTVYRAKKRTKAQREQDGLSEIAMRNMQIERESEIRVAQNNAILTIILLAAEDD